MKIALLGAASALGFAILGSAAPAGAMQATAASVDPNNQPARVDTSLPLKQPPYPDSAQLSGEQGDVVLDVKVGDDGKVRNVKVARSSGFDDLDNAAIEGVLGWKFVPARENGEYSTEWTRLTVTFRLPSSSTAPQSNPPSPS